MSRGRALWVVAAIVISFAGLAGVIMVLLKMKIIGFSVAMLMLATLLGMYVGFGALVAAYLLISKLE